MILPIKTWHLLAQKVMLCPCHTGDRLHCIIGPMMLGKCVLRVAHFYEIIINVFKTALCRSRYGKCNWVYLTKD